MTLQKIEKQKQVQIYQSQILEPMYSSNLNSADAFKQHLREKQHPER